MTSAGLTSALTHWLATPKEVRWAYLHAEGYQLSGEPLYDESTNDKVLLWKLRVSDLNSEERGTFLQFIISGRNDILTQERIDRLNAAKEKMRDPKVKGPHKVLCASLISAEKTGESTFEISRIRSVFKQLGQSTRTLGTTISQMLEKKGEPLIEPASAEISDKRFVLSKHGRDTLENLLESSEQ